jgi:hypothetical protein
VNQPLDIHGHSSPSLAMRVNTLGGPMSPRLSQNPALDASFGVRAADVLLRLATATRPRYQVDVLDMQLHWSLMRYLGFFDSHDGSTDLHLSAAGRRIPGNQRRVTSEEIGIGSATLMAAARPRRPVGSKTKKVTMIGSKRPDYLLISDIPGRTDAVKVAVLECKGTKTPGYSFQQLSSAAHQLQGLLVDGRRPLGLAVSTFLGDAPVTFYAPESPRGPRPAYGDEGEFVDRTSIEPKSTSATTN